MRHLAVALLVVAATTQTAAAQPPTAPATGGPLETTDWKAMELGGDPVPPLPAEREIYLVMACGDSPGPALRFGEALRATATRKISGARLERFDSAGRRRARLEPQAKPSR